MRTVLVTGLMTLFMVSFSHASSLKSCEFSPITNKSTRTAVHAQYGKPDRVIGDPLSIDVYDVTDGGEVWVTWIDKGVKERLLYVQYIGEELDHPKACN